MFFRLGDMIRRSIVSKWLSAGWRAGEPCSCSIQKAGNLRTREVNDVDPVQD